MKYGEVNIFIYLLFNPLLGKGHFILFHISQFFRFYFVKERGGEDWRCFSQFWDGLYRKN